MKMEVIHKMVGGMKAEEFLQNVQNGMGNILCILMRRDMPTGSVIRNSCIVI